MKYINWVRRLFDLAPRRMKIFISPYKGGTTSLGQACCDCLNISTSKRTQWRPLLFNDKQLNTIRNLNYEVDAFETLEVVPIEVTRKIRSELAFVVKAARVFRVCDDYPLGHDAIHPFVKKILFPYSKYIFCERDQHEYVESFQKWERFRGTAIAPEKASITALYSAWHNNHLRLSRTHKDDVLFMNVVQGWEPLCAFLGCSKPAKPFPHLNKARIK